MLNETRTISVRDAKMDRLGLDDLMCRLDLAMPNLAELTVVNPLSLKKSPPRAVRPRW